MTLTTRIEEGYLWRKTGRGQWLVRKPNGTVYSVSTAPDLVSCTCPAGQFNHKKLCKHVADCFLLDKALWESSNVEEVACQS